MRSFLLFGPASGPGLAVSCNPTLLSQELVWRGTCAWCPIGYLTILYPWFEY